MDEKNMNSSLSRDEKRYLFEDLFADAIECPRCLSPLKCHIWPYNLPFDPPDGFETAAQQIATIAGVTPFLLLTHPFALRVHQAIQDLGAATQPEVLGQPY